MDVGPTRNDLKAQAFHSANPHVMERLVEIAFDMRARKIERVSIKLLFERLRWINVVKTKGDQYRLNNSFTAWYAREIMRRHPALAAMFVTRATPHNADHQYRRGAQS